MVHFLLLRMAIRPPNLIRIIVYTDDTATCEGRDLSGRTSDAAANIQHIHSLSYLKHVCEVVFVSD